MKNRPKKLSMAILLLVLFTGIDLWTKYCVASKFIRGESKPIIPNLLNFTLVHNTGAAFGIGHTWSLPFFIVTSVIAIGVVVHLFLKLTDEEILSWWGLILILSGAVGNVVDRIRLGYVVDFIDVYVKTHHWPAFNVADSVITVGAILFGLEILLKKSPKAEIKNG